MYFNYTEKKALVVTSAIPAQSPPQQKLATRKTSQKPKNTLSEVDRLIITNPGLFSNERSLFGDIPVINEEIGVEVPAEKGKRNIHSLYDQIEASATSPKP
ncbi:hypothetical protein NEDG_00364 [Nematocida displodere]|uniref:Uncharacterized protein n=1 Tax=Nematocida displodere TaxID=1805483 RepID=A0A177ELN3_9MICR|nr:hypothetical protein NEDG_00364 [Nematocida displodere]